MSPVGKKEKKETEKLERLVVNRNVLFFFSRVVVVLPSLFLKLHSSRGMLRS